jgi:hypothetical protein
MADYAKKCKVDEELEASMWISSSLPIVERCEKFSFPSRVADFYVIKRACVNRVIGPENKAAK